MISNSSSILNLTSETLSLYFYSCVIMASFVFVTNFLNIIVSLRKSIQNMNSMGLLYTCMSIFNILALISMPYLYFFSQSIGKQDLATLSIYSCLLIPMASRVFSCMTPWLNVIISYDRIQAFNINYKQTFLYKKRNVKLMILVVFLVACMINFTNLLFHLEDQAHVDPVTNQTSFTTICTASTVLQTIRDFLGVFYRILLTLILEFIFNIILIVRLIKFSKNVSEATRNSRDLEKAKRFALTVIIINIVFILGEIPVIACTVLLQIYGYNQSYISTSSDQSAIASFLYLCSIFLSLWICYSSMPIVNLFTNKKYRKEVKKILGLRVKKQTQIRKDILRPRNNVDK